MARWQEVVDEAPELAARVRACLDAHKHKTIATLRKDGSPRISGIEASFVDGDLWFGSMWMALKALDLLRDPRFALHSASVGEDAWDGDAKVVGRAEESTDPERITAFLGGAPGAEPPGPFHLFRAELTEATTIGLNEARDLMVIEFWREGEGVRTIERE
jgi:hypothetical protein